MKSIIFVYSTGMIVNYQYWAMNCLLVNIINLFLIKRGQNCLIANCLSTANNRG